MIKILSVNLTIKQRAEERTQSYLETWSSVEDVRTPFGYKPVIGEVVFTGDSYNGIYYWMILLEYNTEGCTEDKIRCVIKDGRTCIREFISSNHSQWSKKLHDNEYR